ncbi:MAG TPA: DUF885 domain-containing protein, partial [Acidimicrobiia bacterium]|nr:DUF885 domain-containing protein [Acidimicrobiia bacterium]
MSSPVYDLAEHYVERFAALDPLSATGEGIGGHDHEMTDFSPDGAAERAELDRATLRALDALHVESGHVDGGAVQSDAERTAAEVMRERLELALTEHDAGERLRDLRVLGSPVQTVRMVFDLMNRDTADDWHVIAERMALVPQGLASIEDGLAEGAAQGVVAARRQAVACTKQADTWGGLDPNVRPFFHALVDEYDASGLGDNALRTRLETLATRATEAYASLGRFLVEEYAPRADERDPVGRDRYALYAQDFNGIGLDLDETYAWGWDELHRIEHAMGQVAERIIPGADVDTVIEHLETDPARAIEGVDAFQRWNQELLDTTVAQLNGTHFDIPAPVQRVEAMIAPPGGAAAMYYTGPTEDFSRPGRTWYPTLGKTRFPLWGEVSICYHEGVPGHHLQIGQVRYLADTLSRFQRTLAGTSGHAEGWALYAERLMGELGYLDDPAWEMGMLAAQAMRAVRVVVDIGMHLELPIIEGEPHAGERWTPELALPFVIERSRFPETFMRSEVDRYLGWPGQAISYKVGEKVWLEARADAQA